MKIRMIQNVGTVAQGYVKGRIYDTENADEFVRRGYAEPFAGVVPEEVMTVPPAVKEFPANQPAKRAGLQGSIRR
jgi:hypothetical protein